MTERIWGFRAPEVKTVSVRIPGWEGPARVVQLTDLHFGLVTPKRLLDLAVDRANALEPDLVVLTGDFVCRGYRFIGQITNTLARLEAPAVAVLGNHDHWVAADAVRRALERANVEVLQNRWTRVDVRGAPLAVAGMDDSTTRNHDPDATVAGLPDHPVLGLTHNPAAAPLLWERGVRGVLSGHTHAGQFHVKGVTSGLYAKVLGQPFLGGMYEEPGGWVYVSAGLGAGAVPWRTGEPARREVTLLELG
ncbi:MAG: metallophosphoesterase [Myxococcota bacterium]